ncbi:hypothetical protein [Hyphomonas sp.]|uniref:hypothetical protein n=1 Tax=Hyphomonas sp. TaxID=87 RepID=UPI000C954E08|nr:hypothetical protein [Hyphomonas sp.]MAL45603.1 hypothetical protein [Hyphomonas sp.]
MTKLCPRGKAAAKRKFKVYPSAYANSYASKICAGKIKDPSGVKRKDFKGKKPSRSKVASAARRVRRAKLGGAMKVQKAGLGLLAIANLINKEGKRKGRAQAREGELENKMKLSEAQSGLTSEETTGMRIGGMLKTKKIEEETPLSTGSYLKQSIDGDESFVNQSAIDYYKDMGIG